jgi:uncharacterized phage protein gp47/JayE
VQALPWQTPALRDVRGVVRDYVRATLPGADASIANSVLRVLADNQGALCHLNLQYLDWLARQLLPDTAETEWLDRHGQIWLVNADGTSGRKLATFAAGTANFTGVPDTVVPTATQLLGAGSSGSVSFETTAEIVIGAGPTIAPIRALDAGTTGNLADGTVLTLVTQAPGADGFATVITVDGGTDTETDDQLRMRILHRIQNPPMGGAEADYVTWALSVPGVTRAWAAPEQGPGTITVRFLMDDLRADDDGWPTPSDVQTVHDYINTMRPVTVMDCYVLAPIKEFIDIEIDNLVPGTAEVAGAVGKSLHDMLFKAAAPGQTIYAAWISYAIMEAAGVQSFKLVTTDDHVMPSLGHMAVLGTVLYDPVPS